MSYYSERLAEDVTIYRGDCLSVLPTLASFHLISDPPYDQEYQDRFGSKYKVRHPRKDGARALQPLGFAPVNDIRDRFCRAAIPLCNGWSILFCSNDGVGRWRDSIAAVNPKTLVTVMVWVKPDALPKMNGTGPAEAHESIIATWQGEGRPHWNGGGKRGVFYYPTHNNYREGTHPSEKSLELMCDLVRLFTQPGDLVCDPFMGSGTTGLACLRLHRRFVGIELNPDYYDIARRRLLAELREPKLELEAPTRVKTRDLFPGGKNAARQANGGPEHGGPRSGQERPHPDPKPSMVPRRPPDGVQRRDRNIGTVRNRD